jgi:hypothetical protein
MDLRSPDIEASKNKSQVILCTMRRMKHANTVGRHRTTKARNVKHVINVLSTTSAASQDPTDEDS